MSRISVSCFRTLTEFAHGAADDLARRIQSAYGQHGQCRIAIPGGSTPRAAFQQLVSAEMIGRVDWGRIHVFWTDERCVPPDHPSSNFRMGRDILLSHVPIPATQINRIHGELHPEDEVRRYSMVVGDAPMDIVVLGMGSDGHTASLFPGDPEILNTDARVVKTFGPDAPHHRISLTLRTINESHTVCFWVTGKKKADRLARVFRERETGTTSSPAARVSPTGDLVWLLDEAAASKIPMIAKAGHRA